MTKQDDIMAGVSNIILSTKGDKELTIAREIIAYLHYHDVKIQVDGQLPKLSDYNKRLTTSVDFSSGFIVAKGAMLKSGYVAVESLV